MSETDWGHVWGRQGDGGRWHKLAEDCYIDHYLLNRVDSIFRALLSTSAFRLGAHGPPPRVAPNAASTLTWLWLQLADCDCAYITPILPSSSGFTWFAYPHILHVFRLSLCLYSWYILSQKYLIDSSVKG